MDPISIISLAGSTTKTVYQISTQLYLFINRVKDADQSILALSNELSSLRRSLDAISTTLQNPILRSERAIASENTPIWAAVAGSLDDCRQSLQAFESKVAPYQHEKNRRNLLRKSATVWKLNLSDADIRTVRDQTNTHTSSLQIALQTINILISGLSPAKAVEDVNQRVQVLTESVNLLSLHKDAQATPHSADIAAAARSVISGVPELISTGLLQSSDEQVRTSSAKLLKSVITDYERSLRSQDVKERVNESGDEDESSSDEDELRQSLADELCSKADELYQNRKYAEAEKYYRDGLRHLTEILTPRQDSNIEGIRLKLAIVCFQQEKLEEAELMFLILAKNKAVSQSQSLQAYHYLGETYLCLFDFEAAYEYTSIALKGRKNAYGKKDPRYLSTLQLLSLVYEANGDFVTARAYKKRIPSESTIKDQQEENTMAVKLCSGYAQTDCLRMSLKEKQQALTQLSQSEFLIKALAPRPRERSAPFILGVDALDKERALFWAASNNKELMAKWLLSQGASPDRSDVGSPLVEAACFGHESIACLLVDAGAPVNGTGGYDRQSALEWAAERGHESTVRTLLAYGADANLASKCGSTPMLWACRHGHLSIMELLFAAGASIHAKDEYGNTTFYQAAREAHDKAARWLINHGVSLKGALGHTLDRGLEALTEFLLEKDPELTESYSYLNAAISHGANDTIIQTIIDQGGDVNEPSFRGASLVYQCVDSENPDKLRLLLKNGADPNIPDPNTGWYAGTLAKHRTWNKCLPVALEFGFKDCRSSNGEECAKCARHDP